MPVYTGRVLIKAPKIAHFTVTREFNEELFQYTAPARLHLAVATEFLDGVETTIATYENNGELDMATVAFQSAIYQKAVALDAGGADDPFSIYTDIVADEPDDLLTPV